MKQPTVLFSPAPHQRGNGLSAAISYKNPRFLAALNSLFQSDPNEKISQIEIDEQGITVRFEQEKLDEH